MADWAILPKDVLYIILKKTQSVEDSPLKSLEDAARYDEKTKSVEDAPLKSFEGAARYGATCKQWLNSFSINMPKPCPWLVLPSEKFLVPYLNLLNNKFYKDSFTKDKSWGSPYGWSVHLGNGGVYLRNPVSRSRKSLPPLQMDASKVRKAVLLKHVSSSDTQGDHRVEFVVWLLFRGLAEIVYARPGDTAWRTISYHFCKCQDIMYLDEEFFVIHMHGLVTIRDIWSPVPMILGFYVPILPRPSFIRMYLVTVREELHIVVKYDRTRRANYRDIGFEVFKLSLITGIETKVTSLGDYAIFVGNNSSFSLVVSDESKMNPSCLYFTDDSVNGRNFMFDRLSGIFNLETSSLECFRTADHGSLDNISVRSQEYWIVPNSARNERM